MSTVLCKAAAYRDACAEYAKLEAELATARRNLSELDRKHQRAGMRRNEAQRELLEIAQA